MPNNISTRNRFAVLSTDNKNATEYSLIHKLRSDIAALRCTLKEQSCTLKEQRCTLKEQRIDFKEKEDFYLHAVSSEKAYTSKLRNAIKIQKEITKNTEKMMIEDIRVIQRVEIDCISVRMEFISLFKKRVKQWNHRLKVNNFGGFPRRCFQQRSITREQHEKFMENFAKSDLDLRVYYNTEVNSDIEDLLKELYEYGLAFDVVKLTEIRGNNNNICRHAKCVFTYKNTMIKADIFDRYYINFSSKDYTGNQIEFTEKGISLNKSDTDSYLKNGRHTGMDVLEVILDLQKMETKPLFKEPNSTSRSSIIHMRKMMKRQKKMEDEGFKLTRQIISNDENAEQCPICYESYDEDSEHVAPQRYGFAICKCSFGKSICCDCFGRWRRLCPQCKLPWKICMTDEPEIENGLQLPPINVVVLNGQDVLESYGSDGDDE